MGRIARVLKFSAGANANEVLVDTGGGANITCEYVPPPGDDSQPLPGDYVAIMDVDGRGRFVAVGYVDPLNASVSENGERRVYSRDPTTGVKIAEVYLKGDGTIILSNDNGDFTLNPDGSHKGQNSSGSYELQAAGAFVVNGVTISTGGNISTAGSITGDTITDSSNDVTVSTHTHGSGPAPDPGT